MSSNVTVANNEISGAGGSGIYITNSSDLSLVENAIEASRSHGLYITASTGIHVDGGHVSRSGSRASGATRKGIYVNGSSDSLIVGTEVFDNSDIGVYLVNGTSGVRVKNVIAHHNSREYERIASGIELRSSDNIVDSSLGYANEDSGINLRFGGDNALVVNNIAYANGDHGIDVLESSGAQIIGNSVYDNTTAGINVERNSPNALKPVNLLLKV